MSKPGRPSKLTPDRQARLVEALELGVSRIGAARYAGIGAETFFEWMRRGKTEPEGNFRSFRSVVHEAEATAEYEAVRALQRSDPRWFLSRRFAHWREKPAEAKVTHQGPEGAALTMFSDEQLTKLLGLLGAAKSDAVDADE